MTAKTWNEVFARLDAFLDEFSADVRAVADVDEAEFLAAKAAEIGDEYSELRQKAAAWDVVANHPVIGHISSLPDAETYADQVYARLDRLGSDLAKFDLREWEAVQREPWDVLREAADLTDEALVQVRYTGKSLSEWLRLRADYLEAEAAEKSSVDALVEKAARVIHDSDEQGKFPPEEWEVRSEALRNDYRTNARALLAAGLLADGGDKA